MPVTTLGKCIVLVVAVVGMITISTLVMNVTDYIMMTAQEEKGYLVINRVETQQKIRVLALNIISEWIGIIKIYRSRGVRRGDHERFFRLKRMSARLLLLKR